METKSGTIVNLQEEHGYGFIKPNSAISRKEHIFFHCSSVVNTKFSDLAEGDKVEYTEVTTKKGAQAIDVVIF
jgi:cold shock CspA family protein